MNNPRPIKTPSQIAVRVDASGIVAVNARGNEIKYAASPSSPGFNPLELLSASLGICTAINLRKELALGAANSAGVPFEVVVECVKADDAPSRVAQLTMQILLAEGIEAAELAALVSRAESACTIATTLHRGAAVSSEAHSGAHEVASS